MTKPDKAKSEQRYELPFPRMLGIFTRMRLWLHGYYDSYMGKIRSVGDGAFASLYCWKLVEEANDRINIGWRDCNEAMLELKPNLQNRMRKRDEVRRRIALLSTQKKRALGRASAERAGDGAAGEKLAEKRRLRRIAFVNRDFDEWESRLKAQEIEAAAAVEEVLSQYQDCRDIAETNERIVRTEFRARISVYARGASRNMQISVQRISDEMLDEEPKRANDRLFSAYLSGEFPSDD